MHAPIISLINGQVRCGPVSKPDDGKGESPKRKVIPLRLDVRMSGNACKGGKKARRWAGCDLGIITG
jgi:hypothetical protein